MMAEESIDLLVIAIVSGPQNDNLFQQLTDNKFNFTIVNSSGGFFYAPTNCILIGIQQQKLDFLLDLLRDCCQPFMQYVPTRISTHEGGLPPAIIEAKVGGAVIFTTNVEEFFQL